VRTRLPACCAFPQLPCWCLCCCIYCCCWVCCSTAPETRDNQSKQHLLACLLFQCQSATAFPVSSHFIPGTFRRYYATEIRTVALGLHTTSSRVGALVSPFASIDPVRRLWEGTPYAIFCALAVLAAASAYMLPKDRRGQQLAERVEELPNQPPRLASLALSLRLSLRSSKGRRSSSGLPPRGGSAQLEPAKSGGV
jgi:hypothetical protein